MKYKHRETSRAERNSKGMTLLEVVVYCGLFSLAMMAILSAVIFYYRSNRYTLEQYAQLETARKGIALMVQEIREADYSDTGSFPVLSASNNNFTIFSDIDSDSKMEKLRFFLNGLLSQEGITKSSGVPAVYDPANEIISTVSEDVRNQSANIPIFYYYDLNGNLLGGTINPQNIAYVMVKLIVNVNPDTLPNEFTLYSSATLRNLKTNL